MANNAAMAAAEQAQLNVEQSRLPLFHGDKSKDQFTGDQWLERFENAKEAGNWNAACTTSYFYNSLRGLALRWYRMLSVVKINVNDYEQLRSSFVDNYGVQVSNKIVITDFNNLKQRQTEPVQEFFSRVGDIAYNYNAKKPNAEIMGPVPEVEEDDQELEAAWLALTPQQQQRAHERTYKQFAANDISYLALQFFAAGLHSDLQLEVIKSKTASLYDAFMVAQAYETAAANKEKTAPSAINEREAIEDPEEQAEIEALRRDFQKRKLFNANNGSAYQNRNSNGGSNSGNGNNYSSGNTGSSNSTLSGAQPKRNNPAFGKTCYYCKKKNHFQGDCHKRKRENGALIKVKQNEDKDPQLESISSTAPGESCTNNQESKNPFGSLNVDMIVKMCTWKIAENTSLLNRLNKRVSRPHITVNTIQGPTTTWLYDTGADISVMSMREFRKIPIENRPKKKPSKVNISSASNTTMTACGTYEMPITVMDKTVNHDIVIVSNLNSNAIMGIDLIEHLGLVYKAKKKKFIFEEEEPQFREATMETL